MKDSVKGTALALGIVGLVLGGVVGYVVAEGDEGDVAQTDTTQSTDSYSEARADLRNSLNAELREHVTLASDALTTAATDGLEADSTTAAVAELDENSVAIAGLVGDVYPEQEEAFLSLWRDHINFFVDYTVGVVEGDEAAQEQALEDLAGYGEQAATFFTETAGLDLEKQAVQDLLVEHRNLVVDAVDAFAASNYEAFYNAETEAYDQIGTIADALADAIANQQNL